jgi:hypothetical protein
MNGRSVFRRRVEAWGDRAAAGGARFGVPLALGAAALAVAASVRTSPGRQLPPGLACFRQRPRRPIRAGPISKMSSLCDAARCQRFPLGGRPGGNCGAAAVRAAVISGGAWACRRGEQRGVSSCC